jgi:hypothetical protein
LLASSVESERVQAADRIGRADAAGSKTFLLGVLATDPSPKVRSMVLDRVGKLEGSEVTAALRRAASSDPAVEVALKALELYRAQIMAEARKLLASRHDLARRGDDKAGLRLLAKEDERWVSLTRGAMLPAFLQEPPPVFAVKPATGRIRVLAFGDFGNGGPEQREVAAAMQKYHAQNAFDFGITLGDNFYNKGMESPADPRWKTWWSDLYDPLGVQIYASLGNHDWGFAESPAAEVLYTKQSPSWQMPATYYTFTAGPVQFFALDTNEVSQQQLLWLDEQIGRSTAKWKIVYGHHPIYSAGRHADNPTLIRNLLPLLKGRVDMYLAGHDHDMQHLKEEDGVHFFVSGGGGASLRKPEPGPRSLFAQGVHGFSVLDADEHNLTIRFLDSSNKQIYSNTMSK